MKTIEESAIEFIRVKDGFTISPLYDGFKSGVEFAQRWIGFNNELPPIGIEILVKSNHLKAFFITTNHTKIHHLAEQYTHWRPINLD